MVPTFADPELHFFSPTHRYGQKYFPVSQLCLLDLQMPPGQWESQCQAPLLGFLPLADLSPVIFLLP